MSKAAIIVFFTSFLLGQTINKHDGVSSYIYADDIQL